MRTDVRQRVKFNHEGLIYHVELWPRPNVEMRLLATKKQKSAQATLRAFRSFVRKNRVLIEASRPGNA